MSNVRKLSNACVSRKLSRRRFSLFSTKTDPTFDLLQLPPEIREKIYEYSTVVDLINLACCSKPHYKSVLYMLWEAVGIPWEQVYKMSPSRYKSLEFLQYTTSLRFYSSSDHSDVFSSSRPENECVIDKPDNECVLNKPDNDIYLLNKDMVDNYKLIVKACNPDRVQRMSFSWPFHCRDMIKLPCKLFCRNLRELSLRDDYSVTGFWQDVGNLQLLQKLTIENCAFTDNDMKQISNSKCLQEFNLLWNIGITGEGIKHTSTLSGLTKLSLDGSGLRLPPISFKSLAKLSNLRTLSLGYSPIDDGLLVYICSHLKDLNYLSVAGCRNITDCAILNISSNSPTLEALNLNYTSITDKGVYAMHKLVMLRQLFLGNTYISNRGVSYLKHNYRLKELDLSCTSVSGDGILHLNALTSLRVINVKHTLVSRSSLSGLDDFKNMSIIGP